MIILLDTNVLLRSIQPRHPDHARARGAVKHAKTLGFDPCLVPQVVYEFWVVATRPTNVNGLGLSAARGKREVDAALSVFGIRRDERTVFDYWRELVEVYEVHGKSAHDARLVAAMQRHSIAHLLTFNDGDFARYSEITVTNPSNVDSLPVME